MISFLSTFYSFYNGHCYIQRRNIQRIYPEVRTSVKKPPTNHAWGVVLLVK